jgi:hypothetical protein
MIKRKQLFIFAILVTANVVLFSGIISTDGIIMSKDFSFPIRNENFQKYYFPLWNDLSSQPNFERLPRLVMLSPFILLASTGIEISIVLKTFVVATYTFLTIAMYVFLQSIQKYFNLKEKLGKTEIFSVLGAFAFAYNPVSLQFAGGISILFSVGALPLLLYVILSKIDSKYFPFFVAGTFLLSLGHPFTILMNATIGLLFLFVVHWRRINLRFVASRVVFSVSAFLMLFAWFWIPYAAYPVDSIELGKEGNLDRSTFNVASNNDPWNILLLERDRFLYVNTMPSDPTQASLHYASLSLLVGIAISFVLIFLKKIPKRIVFFMIGGFALSVILSMGNRGPLGEAYYFFVSNSDIGWIFRSPLKFQLYESFFISALFGIALGLLQTKLRIKFVSAVVGLFVLIGVSAHGIYDMNSDSFKPISIPAEYYEISDILREKDDGYKVFYYPIYDGTLTQWSEGHVIRSFDMKSSSVPTYEIRGNYNNMSEMLATPYTKPELFRSYNFYDYLSSLSIKYIVFHDDIGRPIDKKNLGHLLQSFQTNVLYNKNNWYLFELDTAVTSPINAVNSIALINVPEDLPKLSKQQLATIYEPSNNSHPMLQDYSHLVKLTASEDNLNISNVRKDTDYNIFDLQGNYERNWNEPKGDFKVSGSADPDTLRYQVMISTSATERSWSWLYSDPVSIEGGDTFFLSFHMNNRNTEGTHIKVSGFVESENKWQDIAIVARGINGDSDWNYYWTVIQATPDITQIRYIINSGNVLDESRGTAVTLIDEIAIYNLNSKYERARIVDYDKITPTLWRASIEADKPFLLTLSETYDENWSVKLNGREVKSIMVYGAINGFLIDKTGNYVVDLYYKPQQLLDVGAATSVITLFVLITYVINQKFSIIGPAPAEWLHRTTKIIMNYLYVTIFLRKESSEKTW